MSVTVRKCTVAELKGAEDFPWLVSEYAEECALAGLPAPDEKLAIYNALAASPVFQAYGAFAGDRLIGFMALLTPVLPHYGVGVAVMESLFVAKEYRSMSGTGLKLLRAAEQHARDANSPGLLVSAPSGGAFADLLDLLPGYRQTNRVFFRELGA